MAERDKATPDPLQMWRDWLGESERQWNGFLNEAMATDEYGAAMNRMTEFYLSYQKGLQGVMEKYFTAINLPTRTDVFTLADRLTEVESRLTNIEAGLRNLPAMVAAAVAAAFPTPVPPAPAPAESSSNAKSGEAPAPASAPKAAAPAGPARTKRPPQAS